MALDPGSFGNVEDYIKALQAENEVLRAKGSRVGRLSIKVSEKGGVSVYGLGRFPVTLYREQWERLLAAKDSIESFIVENMDSLKAKDAPPKPTNGAAVVSF